MLRGEMRYRFWWDRLQPWDFGEFLERKRAGFVARDWLLARIDSVHRNPAQPAFLIIGGPGIGKSAITRGSRCGCQQQIRLRCRAVVFGCSLAQP